MKLRNELSKDLFEFRKDIKSKESDLMSRIVGVRQTFAEKDKGASVERSKTVGEDERRTSEEAVRKEWDAEEAYKPTRNPFKEVKHAPREWDGGGISFKLSSHVLPLAPSYADKYGVESFRDPTLPFILRF